MFWKVRKDLSETTKKIKCLCAIFLKIWPFKSSPREEIGPLNIIKSYLTGKVIKIFAWNLQLRSLWLDFRCHKNFKFVGWKTNILKIKTGNLNVSKLSTLKFPVCTIFNRFNWKFAYSWSQSLSIYGKRIDFSNLKFSDVFRGKRWKIHQKKH